MADILKLLVAIVILIAAVFGFYYFSAEASTLIRVLGILVALGVALFIASRTTVGGNVLGYVHDTRVEVRKVVWPSRQDTRQTTLLVMLMAVVVAIILWGFDSFLRWAVGSITLS